MLMHNDSLDTDNVLVTTVVEPEIHPGLHKHNIGVRRQPEMRIDNAQVKPEEHTKVPHLHLEDKEHFIKKKSEGREMPEQLENFGVSAPHVAQQTKTIHQQRSELQMKVEEVFDEAAKTVKEDKKIEGDRRTCNDATALLSATENEDVIEKASLPTKKKYLCKKCMRSFDSSSNLTSHVRCYLEKNEQIRCQFCEKRFKRRNDLERHKYTYHFQFKLACSGIVDGRSWGCGMVYSRRDALVKHWNGRGKKCITSFQTLQQLPNNINLKDVRKKAMKNLTQPR